VGAIVAGRETARALDGVGVDVDLAPVLDLSDGPLGSRQFRAPSLAVAFARGLGHAACAKHFPGLGSAAISTDERPHVDARIRPKDLAPYRAAIEAGVPCVMVGHGVYPTLGGRRAVVEASTYRLLRDELGFDGITITDSLSVVHGRAAGWAVEAARAGADLLLVNDPVEAARAVRALVPLARTGALDGHVARVLAFRAAFD
jgi:beta-N-acetylhexosaminidase